MPNHLQTQILEVLDRAVSAPTPPPSRQAARRQALGDLNARISALETQLGVAHRLPTLNEARAAARLGELERQIASQTIAPCAAAVPASEPRPVKKTGDAMTDAAVLAAGVPNLRALKAKAKRDQLSAAASILPPGSLARKCAESNLQEAEAELRNCL